MPSSRCGTSPAPAKATLFLPDRLHKSSPTPIDLVDIPLLGTDEYPLPDPPRRPGLGYPKLQCKPLHKAPISTKSSQTTTNKSKSTYGALGNNPAKVLKRISKCGVFFENLKAYASSGIDLGPNADGRLFRDNSNRQFYSTWSACGTAPIPSAEQQLDAIYGISAWFYIQASQKDPVVNCEIAVQDEVQRQILQLMNQIGRAHV